MKLSARIKAALATQAIDGSLIVNLNTLDKHIFDFADEVVQNALQTLHNDAEMALSGDWDVSTEEGLASFEDTKKVIKDLAKFLGVKIQPYK